MKTPFLILLATVFVTLSSPLMAAGEAEWQKVQEAMSHLREPKERPKSREEAMTMIKSGLQSFDEARAAALKAAPDHPLRWDAAVFDFTARRIRDAVGVPATLPPVVMADVLQAADAKPEVKGQASVIDLMETSREAEGPGGDMKGWLVRAEKHLKDYPAEKMNSMIERKIQTLKASADLKSKPLELKFTAVDGREVDLAKMQGKVVLIDFWATWCGPCVAELPNVLKAYKELHPKGFEIVGISLDSDKEKLESFVKERGMEWPQFFDGQGWKNEIASRYGINSIPAMWLVNKKGMVVDTAARGGLEEKVAKLLAE